MIFDRGIVTHRHVTIPPSALRADTSLYTREAVGSGVQHIFNKNAIAGGRIVHKNMGNGADELAVLDDETAGHADVK